MQAAHISNLQRGVVPNVLDSLCLGLRPEKRVKEASINSSKAAVVWREMHCKSKSGNRNGPGEAVLSAPKPRLCMQST